MSITRLTLGYRLLLLLLVFTPSGFAKFTNPSGEDGENEFEVGQKLTVAWDGTETYKILSLGMFEATNQTITWFISDSTENPTDFDWTVDHYGFSIRTSRLFQLIITNGTNFGSPFYSPKFLIKERESTSTSTTPVSLSTVAPSSPTTTTNTASSQPSQPLSLSGLTAGGKAGVGIGVVAAFAVGIGVSYWFFRMRGRKLAGGPAGFYGGEKPPHYYLQQTDLQQQQEGQQHGSRRAELDVSNENSRYEMSGS